MLPIRQTANPNEAVASLLTNHASIEVADQLGEYLAEIVADYEPEVIVGLPTLGLSVARTVAKALGHSRYPCALCLFLIYVTDCNLERYVPLGYSRKFWYSDALSAQVSSITSPDRKKIYLDPNSLSLLKGKKVIIIDDAVSTGTTLKMSWDLLGSQLVGCEVLGAGVVMKQGEAWRNTMGWDLEDKVVWVFDSPLLKKVNAGWVLRE